MTLRKGALLLFPFCTQSSARVGDDLETQSWLLADTLKQTFDVTNCSFHHIEIISNEEILGFLYPNWPSLGIPSAQKP